MGVAAGLRRSGCTPLRRGQYRVLVLAIAHALTSGGEATIDATADAQAWWDHFPC
ncbi:MAG TPA: hypothetical protein VF952_01095 [Chloroflexia bacterium]